MNPLLGKVDHRPWPLPFGKWNMRQDWLDLLFAHWPIPSKLLRPLVPSELEIEEFDGTSWIGVVPFRMSGVMLRPLPDLPWISAFPELNVRLYVRFREKPGVYFLSLDASNPLAAFGAWWGYHLPYYWSKVTQKPLPKGDPSYSFHFQARCRRANPQLVFEARYGPAGEPFFAKAGTLEHFLTERYCLYTKHRNGTVLRVDVHHLPWPLQAAKAEIQAGDMLRPFGLLLPDQTPHLLFSTGVKTLCWPVRNTIDGEH